MALFIGLITGTSVDGIDTALVDLSNGVETLAANTYQIPSQIRLELLKAKKANNLENTLLLDIKLGELLATAALDLLKSQRYTPADITAIGSHGQTVYHSPNTNPAFTLQIGDPNVIASRTGIDTIADFRRRDLAEGGQGAPLAPGFHNVLFRASDKTRAILNIGGIANLTVLPKNSHENVIGFDTGPGNALMDAWASQNHRGKMDIDGHWAAQGNLCSLLLTELLADPYFASPMPKSTGREYFSPEWLRKHIAKHLTVNPADIQRTLLQLTVDTVLYSLTKIVAKPIDELFVCGGGVHNNFLMNKLRDSLPFMGVKSSAAAGIDPDYVEAIGFAWLAKQTLNNLPGNVTSVTGATREAVLGGLYRGSLRPLDK